MNLFYLTRLLIFPLWPECRRLYLALPPPPSLTTFKMSAEFQMTKAPVNLSTPFSHTPVTDPFFSSSRILLTQAATSLLASHHPSPVLFKGFYSSLSPVDRRSRCFCIFPRFSNFSVVRALTPANNDPPAPLLKLFCSAWFDIVILTEKDRSSVIWAEEFWLPPLRSSTYADLNDSPEILCSPQRGGKAV